jgi:hypothetical protein
VTTARVMLIVLGLMIGGYGAVLVWDNPPVIIMRIVVWALVGVVLHDAVFAPLCVALGFAGRRLIPGKWWPGMRPDNMTVLDRNYSLGLWISLATVWACVPLYYLAKAVRRRPNAGPGADPLHGSSVEIDTRAGDDRLVRRTHSPDDNLGHGTHKLPVRQDEVVEQQRADDVERQPPAV